jgi:hypothetical protein
MAKQPVAIGLSLCEQVIIEEKTRNVTLVNCFSERTAEKFPSDPIPFVAFAHLTDGLGDINLELVVERLDTMGEVYRRSLKTSFPDSLRVGRFCLHVRDCIFPVAGKYQITLLADGEFLAQRRITILATENQS